MVDFRFDGEVLLLMIKTSAHVQQMELELEKKLADLSAFLGAESKISVYFEGGEDQIPLIPLITSKLKDRSIHLSHIHFEKPPLPSVKTTIPSQTHHTHDEPVNHAIPVPPPAPKIEVFQGTVRSGQVITASGDLLVIGNINAGAEVIAGGSLVVFGEIRGSIRAGQNFEGDAFVIGTYLQPIQIQIEDVLSQSIRSDSASMCVLKNGHLTLVPIITSSPLIYS